MIMIFKLFLVLSVIVVQTTTSFCFHIDNLYSGKLGNGLSKNHASINALFSPMAKKFTGADIVTEPKALLHVIKDTLRYFHVHAATEKAYPTFHNISCERVKKTLEFVASTIEQDLPSRKFRILDSHFIHENFRILQWSADAQSAQQVNSTFPQDGRIRLTNYAVFCVQGSRKKTSECPYALYQLHDSAIKKQYTKHQILSGVFEKPFNKGKTRPLVWLSRDGIEDALMQGTIAVRFNDGKTEVFGLDCDNGILYDKALKDPKEQQRYWFFRRIAYAGADANQAAYKIAQRAQVVFAGDIAALGVGKLLAIKYQDPISGKESLRLGVLADTGSAFSNNLYQLDLFAGLFTSRQHFSQYMKTSPQFAQAFILYR